jgi:hypothetical protein
MARGLGALAMMILLGAGSLPGQEAASNIILDSVVSVRPAPYQRRSDERR